MKQVERQNVCKKQLGIDANETKIASETKREVLKYLATIHNPQQIASSVT